MTLQRSAPMKQKQVRREVEPGYCQCGCGEWIGFWKENGPARNRVKGEPKSYARGHNGRIHDPSYYRQKFCATCEAPISKQNTTGDCNGCQMASVGRNNALPKPKCSNCGRHTPRTRDKYCSRACYEECRTTPVGEEHWSWLGDNTSQNTQYGRAQKLVQIQPCEFCGDPAAVRHHVDRDTLNNSLENIQFLCRSHHKKLHNHEDGYFGWAAVLND